MGNKKMLKKMFKDVTKKEMLNYFKEYMDYYKKYKRYLLEHEPCSVDFNDMEQYKYFACYDCLEDVIYTQVTQTTKHAGVTYTTSEQAISDYINSIGKDNFKKYILGL